MAEERIYITEVKEGDVCPIEEYCEEFSELCEGCNVLPTRQEAIERMAKAICKETNYQCSVCDFGDNKEKCEEWIYLQYKASAEAALNALLEEK